MYSQSKLLIAFGASGAIEQFDQARTIQETHDRLEHGYQTPNLIEQTNQLQKLVDELIAMWKI